MYCNYSVCYVYWLYRFTHGDILLWLHFNKLSDLTDVILWTFTLHTLTAHYTLRVYNVVHAPHCAVYGRVW